MYFADGLDVIGKGKRRIFIFSSSVDIGAIYWDGDCLNGGGRKFRKEMISPTFEHMVLQSLLKSCPS